MLDGANGPEEFIAISDGVTAAALNWVWPTRVQRRFEGSYDLRCKVQLAGGSHYSYNGEGPAGDADPRIMFVYKPWGSVKHEHIAAGVHERSITLVFPMSDAGVGGYGRDDPAVDRALRAMGDQVLARERAMSKAIGNLAASILDADRSARSFEKLQRLRMDELACVTLDLFLESFEEATDRGLTPRERRQVLDARDVLLADLGAPPSLNRLATAVGTNRTKLNRGFQSVFGVSPYQYLHRARMAHARALLERGDLSVTDVAAQCGYEHVSNFSLAVKAFYGRGPSALRSRAPA